MKRILLALSVTFLVLMTSNLYAPPGGGSGPACWPPPCIPADNGIKWMILGGFLLAIYKIVDIRRKEKSEQASK